MSNSTAAVDSQVVTLYEHVVTMAFINICASFIALITCLVFKNQRKFPVSIVAWISAVNLAYNLFLVLASSNTVLRPLYSKLEDIFRLLNTLREFSIIAGVCTSTMLAFSIHEMLRRNKDMSSDKHPWYRVAFVALFWSFTLGFAFGVGFSPSYEVLGVPVPISMAAIAVSFVVFAVGVLLQTSFIVLTLVHIIHINNSISSKLPASARRNRRKDYWMYGRFVSIILLQILQNIVGFVFWFEVSLKKQPTISTAEWAAFATGIATLGESLVIIASNRSLRHWVQEVVLRQDIHSSRENSGSHRSPTAEAEHMSVVVGV